MQGRDLWLNFKAVLTGNPTDWHGISVFNNEVFYPYFLGGMLPGILCATISYYISVPLIRAYQKRRKGVIKAKFEALKAKRGRQGQSETSRGGVTRQCTSPYRYNSRPDAA